MSAGRTWASTRSVSSSGTISARSAPGWTTPPIVAIFRVLIVPRTGERTSVRRTRSSPAVTTSLRPAISASCAFRSRWASARKVENAFSIRLPASPSADSARGMASRFCSSSPCRSFT